MSNTDKIFKPRRGTKTTFSSTKANTILDIGEVFFEVPDEGQGSGRVRLKMGDGITEYSNLPYAIPFTEDEIIVHNGTDTKSISASSSIQSTAIATNLNNAKSGNSLKNIIHNLREAIYKCACDISYLDSKRSYVGMIIYSTILSTESSVIDQYGGTAWIQLSGYMLRGATSGVTANSNAKDGGNDSISYTPSGNISSSFSGTAASLSHTGGSCSASFSGTQASLSHSGGSVSSHTLTTAEMPSHNHFGKMKFSSSYFGAVWAAYGSGSTANALHISVGTEAEGTNITPVSNGGGQGHSHGFTQPSAHTYTPAGSVSCTHKDPNTHTFTPSGSVTSTFTGTADSINTLPKYKNVYIWERTA